VVTFSGQNYEVRLNGAASGTGTYSISGDTITLEGQYFTRTFGRWDTWTITGRDANGNPTSIRTHENSTITKIVVPGGNSPSDFIKNTLRARERHTYRVDNMTDSYYFIMWRDLDNSANNVITEPFADIQITVLNSSGAVVVPVTDIETDRNREGIINSIRIDMGTHYSNNGSVIIIVQGVGGSSGNYGILVY